MNSDVVQNTACNCGQILEDIREAGAGDDGKKLKILQTYMNSCYEPVGHADDGNGNGHLKGKNVIDLDLYSSDLQWMTSRSAGPVPVPVPSLKAEEMDHVFVVEFFTYCCINCTHSMQDLRKIYNELTEERTESCNKTRFRFIAIHSPKFTREKNQDSLDSFIQKYQLSHTSVINDPELKLWNQLGIFCWPTILILGPNKNTQSTFKPNLLFALYGEGHYEVMKYVLSETLKYFDERLDAFPSSLKSNIIEIDQEIKETKITFQETNQELSVLKYPGKILLYGDGLLAISDSGNNRIVISTINGEIRELIGGKSRGFHDGDFESCLFDNPQGMAFNVNGSSLYIADSGNHCIREISFQTRTITTLIPSNYEIGDEKLLLKSPWDLAINNDGVMFIAGAGNHQIFGHFLKPVQIFGKNYELGSTALLAGTGREENRNNSYILKASFAQPSGLSFQDQSLYIADSESSSIRSLNCSGKGQVLPLVGGSKNPQDLFAYGDQDGHGSEVKLQHPVGICCSDSGLVYIADTYNNKVKVIDVETKFCKTIIGTGKAGDDLGQFIMTIDEVNGNHENVATLNEPGGLAIDNQNGLLYIVDTNNNKIKVANLKTKIVSEMLLKETKKNVLPSSTKNYDASFDINVLKSRKVKFELNVFNLPENYENGEWKIYSSGQSDLMQSGQVENFNSNTMKGSIGPIEFEIKSTAADHQSHFLLNLLIFYCKNECCFRKSLTLCFSLKYNVDKADSPGELSNTFDYHLEKKLFE